MYKMKIFLQQRQKWSKICGAVGNEGEWEGIFSRMKINWKVMWNDEQRKKCFVLHACSLSPAKPMPRKKSLTAFTAMMMCRLKDEDFNFSHTWELIKFNNEI